MITLLDTVGPAVLRASWQAAVLALVVMLSGAVAWGTHVATVALSALECRRRPAAVRGDSSQSLERVQSRPSGSRRRARGRSLVHDADPKTAPDADSGRPRRSAGRRPIREREFNRRGMSSSAAKSPAPATARPRFRRPFPPRSRWNPCHPWSVRLATRLIVRILSSVWLAGCLLFGLQLFGAALVLRRRLSVCRPVTDAAVLTAAGIRLSTDRTQTASRLAGDAGIDQSLHRGNLEAQNHRAGIDRYGIFEHEAPACAGARTGASCAWRSVDELAASDRADSALVQSRGLVDDPGDAGRTRSRL